MGVSEEKSEPAVAKGAGPSASSPVTDKELYTIMLEDLKKSADPATSPDIRFSCLQNAAMIAEGYSQQHGRNSVPAELLDQQLVRSNLLAYGNMALANSAHDVNASSDNPSKISINLRTAEAMIRYMDEAGIQKREQSYAMFGGEDHFNRRLAEANRLKDAPVARGMAEVEIKNAEPYVPGAGAPKLMANNQDVLGLYAKLTTAPPVFDRQVAAAPATPRM